jgi:hypothetical protein
LSGGTGATGAAGAPGAAVTGRTLWFQNLTGNGVNSGQCLGHQDNSVAACTGTTGTANSTANFVTRYQVVAAGALGSLWAETDTVPGAGKSWVVTVRVNAIVTTLTCTVSNPAAAGQATNACEVSSAVAVLPGDQVDVQLTTANTAAPGHWKTYVTFTPTPLP